MRDTHLEEALIAFISDSKREKNLENLISACEPFVITQARLWHSSKLPFVERCRELLSEIFLILIEDFCADKAARPASILSYLSLRLRRLTRPKTSKELSIGLLEDFPNSGRCSFTPLRFDLVREITFCTRKHLLNYENETIRKLEFIFIHIVPHLAGISRFLASIAGEDPQSRIEADKKRHALFMKQLRCAYDNIESGDWRGIIDWSHGERSHLAWRLINFTESEREILGEGLALKLDLWRDELEPCLPNKTRDDLASTAIEALSHAYKKNSQNLSCLKFVSESADNYQNCSDDENLFAILLNPAFKPCGMQSGLHVLRQENSTYSSNIDACMTTSEEALQDEIEAYRKAAADVKDWFLLFSSGINKPNKSRKSFISHR